MGQLLKDYEEMRILLKESAMAFSIMMESGGSSNTDYADYTSNNFIRGFRHILQKPDLSRAQLASMLRLAERRQKHRDNDEQWAGFMASVIANGAINNNEQAVN